ncbi:MAG TPA: glutaredoxin family protein [Polyangiaceae bacterium]|nr:glutaredoxin family protein [Polyangiaceae bacterium]
MVSLSAFPPLAPRQLLPLMLAVCALSLIGCKHSSSTDAKQQAASGAAGVTAGGLPPLILNDSSTNLMLTWVDEKGDFHVVQQIAEVPADHKDPVRVVVMGQEAGTGQQVYVANLGQKAANGSYAVHVASRAEWDNVGASRRKERLDALKPTAAALASAAAKPTLAPGGKLHATIYGASWCKPCHQAQDFLQSLGVEVTKKDIEESAAAQAEMRQKLAAAHRSGSSIPVIDFMGNIMIGFNADALRQLVEQARGTAHPDQTL